MFNRKLSALAAATCTVSLLGACSLFNHDVILAGKVVEMQADSALVSVHSTANAEPGQRLNVYKMIIIPAGQPTSPPWHRPERTGTAVVSEVIGNHAVRVKITSGFISAEDDVEIRK